MFGGSSLKLDLCFPIKMGTERTSAVILFYILPHPHFALWRDYHPGRRNIYYCKLFTWILDTRSDGYLTATVVSEGFT